MGGKFPPSRRLCPRTCPPSQKKKMAKISHFRQIFDFCPLRIAFCPPRCPPHKKISGAATAVLPSRISPLGVSFIVENRVTRGFECFYLFTSELKWPRHAIVCCGVHTWGLTMCFTLKLNCQPNVRKPGLFGSFFRFWPRLTYGPGPAASDPGPLIIWKNILSQNMLQDHN